MLKEVTDIWRSRRLLWALARGDMKRRFQRTPLGVMLSFLKPLALTAVFCLVFCNLFRCEVTEYAPFLMCGMTVWQLLQDSTLSGCFTFQHGSPFLLQKPLPLGLFPLRTVLFNCQHFFVLLLLTIGLICVCHGAVPLWGIACAILVVPLILVLCWSLALIAGVLNTFNGGTYAVLEIVLQTLYVLTPILYPPDFFRQNDLLTWVDLNPLTYVLEVIREPLLGRTVPLERMAVFLGFVVSVFGLALYVSRRVEKQLVFWVRPALEA